MKLSNVEEYNWFYALIKPFVNFMHNHIFYKKVYTQGLENIPKDGAVIFAPNHQNALMDALIILCLKSWQPVFMARADIFAGHFVRRILFFLKILPIFRQRDGKDNLTQNDAVFQKAVMVLKKKRYLTIFPEASHLGRRKLRPLKKGLTRIAFLAEEKEDFKLGVTIVPVGINYENYFKFRSNILISFGQPIKVSDYKEIYQENPQKANHDLIGKVSEEIKKLIININENDDFYFNFETARTIFAPYILRQEKKLLSNFKNTVYAGQKTVKILEAFKQTNNEEFLQLNTELKEYGQLLQKVNLRDWTIRKNVPYWTIILTFLVMLITAPIALFGFINNFLPYILPKFLTSKIKDKNFHTSVRFVIYMFSFPVIFYPLIIFLVCKIIDPIWLKILYLAMVPISGLFAHRYLEWFFKLKAMIKYRIKNNNQDIKRLTKLRKIILEKLINIYNEIKND